MSCESRMQLDGTAVARHRESLPTSYYLNIQQLVDTRALLSTVNPLAIYLPRLARYSRCTTKPWDVILYPPVAPPPGNAP